MTRNILIDLLRVPASVLHGARNPHVYPNTFRLLRAMRLAARPLATASQHVFNSFFLFISIALMLSACGGGKVVPDWKKDSVSLIEKYKKAELKGKNTLAERYFEQALDATGSAAKIEETAKLHLIRCATRQASLVFENCTGYLEFAKLGTSPEDDTYHRFISGEWEKLDSGKLPSQYRDFASNRDTARNQAILQKIDDPLSRLIAISIAVMRKQADDNTLNLAVETASEQGWSKPLLVYLKLLENRANLKSDKATAEKLRARIKLVEESL